MTDWRHAYEQTRRRYERDVAAARARGQTTFQIGSGRTFDPTRLSERQRERLVREAATSTTERAINQHNERRA